MTTATLDQTLDTVAAVVKIIGDTAVVAMQVGKVVLPILQDVGLFFPPSAVAANYVSVAMPYITEVATYAPAVQSSIQNGKPMIEAAIGIGDALLGPFFGLFNDIPGLSGSHPFMTELDAWFKANEYTPQDPRFQRGAPDAA